MFIQFGNVGLNTDHITRCHRYDSDGEMSIEVHTSDGGFVFLKEDDALDFADWWDANCDTAYSESWYLKPRDQVNLVHRVKEPLTASAEGRNSSGHGQV